MWQAIKQGILAVTVVGILVLSATTSLNAQVSVATHTGKFVDGATYLIEVPSNWHGTLFLYSHGYVVPGSPNPAEDVGDPLPLDGRSRMH
jgi:hypothetical protein